MIIFTHSTFFFIYKKNTFLPFQHRKEVDSFPLCWWKKGYFIKKSTSLSLPCLSLYISNFIFCIWTGPYTGTNLIMFHNCISKEHHNLLTKPILIKKKYTYKNILMIRVSVSLSLTWVTRPNKNFFDKIV